MYIVLIHVCHPKRDTRSSERLPLFQLPRAPRRYEPRLSGAALHAQAEASFGFLLGEGGAWGGVGGWGGSQMPGLGLKLWEISAGWLKVLEV